MLLYLTPHQEVPRTYILHNVAQANVIFCRMCQENMLFQCCWGERSSGFRSLPFYCWTMLSWYRKCVMYRKKQHLPDFVMRPTVVKVLEMVAKDIIGTHTTWHAVHLQVLLCQCCLFRQTSWLCDFLPKGRVWFVDFVLLQDYQKEDAVLTSRLRILFFRTNCVLSEIVFGDT